MIFKHLFVRSSLIRVLMRTTKYKPMYEFSLCTRSRVPHVRTRLALSDNQTNHIFPRGCLCFQSCRTSNAMSGKMDCMARFWPSSRPVSSSFSGTLQDNNPHPFPLSMASSIDHCYSIRTVVYQLITCRPCCQFVVGKAAHLKSARRSIFSAK
jgi:hypothetical protein